jgi:hypothetical protein
MAESPDSSDRWAWLADTYWYVPEITLPALQVTNLRNPDVRIVQDQTLWHLERFDSGYVFGACRASLDGGDFQDLAMFGSVTPPGDVLFSFAPRDPVDASPRSGVTVAAMTTGIGRMVRHQGQWAFLMQMTGGTSAVSVSHWSYMLRSTPDDPSWTDIPGLPGMTMGEVFG